jgi:hypothetical protein
MLFLTPYMWNGKRQAYHFLHLKHHPTCALEWLMEHLHVLPQLLVGETLPTFATVFMLPHFFFPQHHTTTWMLARNIVPPDKKIPSLVWHTHQEVEA